MRMLCPECKAGLYPWSHMPGCSANKGLMPAPNMADIDYEIEKLRWKRLSELRRLVRKMEGSRQISVTVGDLRWIIEQFDQNDHSRTLQWRATMTAVRFWRKHTNKRNARIVPDLRQLLNWFIKRERAAQTARLRVKIRAQDQARRASRRRSRGY